MALMPLESEQLPISQALQVLSSSNRDQLTIFVQTHPAKLLDHVALVRQLLKRPDASTLLHELTQSDQQFEQMLQFYGKARRQLLSLKQARELDGLTDAELLARAQANLYGLENSPLLPWTEDPLGLWQSWLIEQNHAENFSLENDFLHVNQGQQSTAILQFALSQSAFKLDATPRLQALIDSVRTELRALDPTAEVFAVGIPLIAEAAAVQASKEITLIGGASFLVIVVLSCLAFRSVLPFALIAGSLLIGLLAAISVSFWVFGELHVLTLVFGASLIGVAEDYGIHYFVHRQYHPKQTASAAMQQLQSPLALALVTSAMAYLALGIAPLVGLRQMAVFSVCGLAGAFFTVWLFFPVRELALKPAGKFSGFLGRSLRFWPRWRANATWTTLSVVLLGLCAVSLSQLRVEDDLRALHDMSASALEAQKKAAALLELPSPAQFFIIAANTPQALLTKEEALKPQLQGLRERGLIKAWRSISDWMPSEAMQARNEQRLRTLEQRIFVAAAPLIGETIRLEPSAAPLSLAAWLKDPVSLPHRSLWLGPIAQRYYSVVQIYGVTPNSVPVLAALDASAEGVHWINLTERFGHLLKHYREQMSGLLAVGVVLVYLLLYFSYGTNSWRAVVPTVLAAVIAVSAQAACGIPLQLFTVLALALLVGVGIDYGIFQLDQNADAASWVAINLGAASTVMAFGTLSLSTTPALRAFGFVMLVGVVSVWLLTPIFRVGADDAH